MEKPILIEAFADNGELSHWELIDTENGSVLWTSFPEETIAKGQSINCNICEKTIKSFSSIWGNFYPPPFTK
jgi:hypothetical protein